MPRANRCHIPGQVWHITHRCHKREFLFKFVKDRNTWLKWLFESQKRYNLCILNYMVTSNHIHLLLADDESDAISKSIQLTAGRTAQAFNRRKGRAGAYWEDRYHATAIESGEHLLRCLVYIDMNMVRARVVSHPSKWHHCGYAEIQQPPPRYRLIDRARLIDLCGMGSEQQLVKQHRDWVEQAVENYALGRDEKWSESVAVGGHEFVKRLQQKLGHRVANRKIERDDDIYMLHEPETTAYRTHFDAKKGRLSVDNGVYFDENKGDTVS